MTLSWNVVTKRIRPHDQLQEKFRRKIAKLEKHLQHFPPDAVHLQIALERHARKPEFTSSLTLRVPSNILHGSKKASSPVTAFDQSIRALIRELETLKSHFRKERTWRKPVRETRGVGKPRTAFAAQPLPPGRGPRDLSEVVADFLELNYARLLRYVSRQITHCEITGRIRRGGVDARAVVDEVARKVLSAPEKKPRKLSYPLWFYTLARQELGRRLRQAKEQGKHVQPLRKRTRVIEESEEDQRSPEIVERSFESQGIDTEDWLPDEHSQGPDVVAAGHDLLNQLQALAVGWPRKDREVFELYFVEGFDEAEIALMEKLTLSQVGDTIETIQNRMRESFVEAAQKAAPKLKSSLSHPLGT